MSYNRFDCPYPMDHVYLKVAGCKQIMSEALCELLAVTEPGETIHYDSRKSSATEISIIVKKKDVVIKQHTIPISQLIRKLQLDLFNDKMKIVELCIQPEGEMQTPELTSFIEKHQH